MSSTGTSVARRITADALKVNWPALELRFALRCTAGVALPLIVSTLAGAPLDGASAAYGALMVGFASRQGVYRTRVRAMLVSAGVLALSAFAGAVSGPVVPLNIALLALWAFVFGLIGSLGRLSSMVATNACVAFIVFSNAPYDTSSPLLQASMLVAGGLVQMVLLVAVWPLSGPGAERSALARAYTKLAQYAAAMQADDLGLPDTESVTAVSAALADPQPFAGRAEIAAYQALADEADRLRGSLAALATEAHLLGDVGATGAAQAVRTVCSSAAAVLTEIATAVAAGREPAQRAHETQELDAAVRALERIGADRAPYVDDARALAGQLRSALHAAAAAANGGLAVEAELPPPGRGRGGLQLRGLFDRIVANASFGSTFARHAVRTGIALAVAVIVQHLVPLAHGQWIALTVALVLRPDFSSTFTRGLARVAGTVGGAVLASAIAAFHPGTTAYIVLAIVFAGTAFAIFNVSYALFSLAITGYVVYLLAYGGAPEHLSAIDRVAATLVGAVIALIAYALWPAWTHTHIGDDLAALLDAQRTYVGRVLGAFREADVDEAAIAAAQAAAWRARSNAEAALEAMAAEPVAPEGLSLRSAAGILAATRRFGIAVLTLRTRVGRITFAPHALVDRFYSDVDQAMRVLADALRSGTAPPGLPPLRADQIALRRALEARHDPAIAVLIAETDLIVDSLNTMAAILSR